MVISNLNVSSVEEARVATISHEIWRVARSVLCSDSHYVLLFLPVPRNHALLRFPRSAEEYDSQWETRKLYIGIQLLLSTVHAETYPT